MKEILEKNNEINLIKKKYAKKKELTHKHEKIIKENEEQSTIIISNYKNNQKKADL